MVKGHNAWFDLVTADVEDAKRFYSETIGWKTQQWEHAPADKPYTMWMVDEAALGGVVPLSEEATKMGVPPHWMAYTTVENADETVAQAEKLGGKIHKAPFDIPNVGRIAFLADPQGAAFAILQPNDEMKPADSNKHGQFSWAELNTTDHEAAWKFYSELFGWKERSKMDMGPAGTYFMFHNEGETTKGGMSNMAAQMKMPAHWLHYVTVDDMDGAIERIKKQGGKILNGPMPIPGDDVIAQCMDPQGAAFAIYAEGKKD